MSVIGAKLETICKSLAVLKTTVYNQYGTRGQTHFDKVVTAVS